MDIDKIKFCPDFRSNRDEFEGNMHTRRNIKFERLEDRRMLAQFVVTNTANSGSGSLFDAINDADDSPGKDEIVFAQSLFQFGTPVIIRDNAISVDEPVHIHSEYGPVILRKLSASDAEEALILRPAPNGIGQNFEINDLIIENFKYGIRIADTGAAPGAGIEGIKIVGNAVLNAERAIFFDTRAIVPFEISSNDFFGDPTTTTPEPASEAGIWIENTNTQVNSHVNFISNNFIGDFEDYGIFVSHGGGLPNLSIRGNRIGADTAGNSAPNGYGIYATGNGKLIADISQNNEILHNAVGIEFVGVDDTLIDGNLIAVT